MKYGKIDIKKAVKGEFNISCVIDGAVWYETYDGLCFPIPFEETKGGVFNARMKGTILMRWIRKWNEKIEKDKMEMSQNEITK